MGKVNIFDKIIFNPEFNFQEEQLKIKEWEESDYNNDNRSEFQIEFDYSGCGNLDFELTAKNKNGHVFSFNIKPDKTIELYYTLKKEIEEIKTKQELASFLEMGYF
jgi:hypothetical protein